MPYEIKIEDDGAKITTRYFGHLTTGDITSAYQERFTDIGRIKKLKILLSDYSDVTQIDLHDVDISSLAEFYKTASAYNRKVVSVAIMPKDILFGLGRMWEAYVDGISWKAGIFRTKEEAQAFLQEHEIG